MSWPIFHPFLHPLSWVLGKVCFHSTSHSSRSCLPDPAQQLSQKQHLVGFQACLFFLPPEFSLPLCVILLFPHLTSSCVLVLCAVADTPQRKMFFSENLLAFHRVWNAVVNGFVVGLLDACFSCVWERKTVCVFVSHCYSTYIIPSPGGHVCVCESFVIGWSSSSFQPLLVHLESWSSCSHSETVAPRQ